MKNTILKLAISLSILSSSVLLSARAYAITILQPGYKVDVIPTGNYSLQQPSGIAFDRNDNIYIADNLFDGTSRLLKIYPSGQVSQIVTFPTFIGGLATNKKGEIFGSLDNRTIFKLDKDVVTTFATDLPSGSAEKLTFDKRGNLYVAYFNAQAIAKISPKGEATIFVSNLGGPFAVAFKNNTLFIGDNSNFGAGPGEIKQVTNQGNVTTFFSPLRNRVVDLEYNANQDSFFVAIQGGYSANYGSEPAIDIIRNQQLTTFATGFSEFPRDLKFDRKGNLYVVDNQKFYKISPTLSIIKELPSK
jgi:hypothetical protein